MIPIVPSVVVFFGLPNWFVGTPLNPRELQWKWSAYSDEYREDVVGNNVIRLWLCKHYRRGCIYGFGDVSTTLFRRYV